MSSNFRNMNHINPMYPAPYTPAAAAPPPWPPALPPCPPPSTAFWTGPNVHNHLKELNDTINLAKALQKELEVVIKCKQKENSAEDDDGSVDNFSGFLKNNKIDMKSQELLSLEAANDLISKLRAQVEPFRVVTDEASPWEEKSAALRLANKMQKNKRNKLWRKRKKRRVAEELAKEAEGFEQVDKEADDWRAREIAKDIAKRKVEKMKEIAKLKANEERKRLESELELVLMVEKLQELRSIRIQKLKKQGHFLPEEDNKFLERVRAAVEEEERQAIAAADTEAAKGAIATAEESRKSFLNQGLGTGALQPDNSLDKEIEDQISESKSKTDVSTIIEKGSGKLASEGPESGGYDAIVNLPIEFYHYYYGSNNDMGTLIEVRRMWDSYIRPGGSRIPGHWVQPPPPADEIWASYLVKPK